LRERIATPSLPPGGAGRAARRRFAAGRSTGCARFFRGVAMGPTTLAVRGGGRNSTGRVARAPRAPYIGITLAALAAPEVHMPWSELRARPARAALAAAAALALAACGGGDAGPTAVAPTITGQPANASVLEGAPASFTVTATGTAPLAYQWASSFDGGPWTDVAGATAATLNIAAASTLQSGTAVRVTVSNVAGTATSAAAVLTVEAQVAPEITVQPDRTTVVAGAAATFTAAATGTPAPSVQWQRSTDGTTWTDVAGATAPTLVTGPTVAGDGCTEYRAVFTNGAGSATSDPGLLGVEPVAVTPAYEPFDYAAGATLAGQDGGSGWGGAWGVTQQGPTSALTGASSGTIGAGLGYVDGAGNTLVTAGGAWETSAPTYFGQAQRATASTAGTACTSRWASVLVRHSAVTTGINYAAATLGTGYSFGSPAMIAGFNFKAGFTTCFYCSSGGDGEALPDFVAGSVGLVVFRTDFAKAGNDTLSAWFDPPLGAPLGPPDASSSNANYGSVIGGFTLAWGDYRSWAFDEVRTGLTAASVLPYVPKP